jgi:hypothetical protein
MVAKNALIKAPDKRIGSRVGGFRVHPRLWILFALFAITTVWASGIPFGGVADEPEYLQYGAYSLSHDLLGTGTLDSGLLKNIGNSPCFAFHPEISANCQNFVSKANAVNGKPPLSPYPKIWFYLTAWPALLFSGQLGLVLAKVLAGLVALGILSLPIIFWKKTNKKLALSLAVALPSLSIQMLGSYNPNGFEIAGLTAIALMLYGQSPREMTERPKSWWFSIWITTLLASAAKPMTGLLTFFIFCMYHFFAALTEDDYVRNHLSRNALKVKTNLQLVLLPISGLIFSYVLTRPTLAAAKIAIKPNHQGFFHLALGFLTHSDSYANEYAGIFGWRELGPAPWCTSAWIAILSVIIYKSAADCKFKAKMAVGTIWFIVLIIAPMLEVISLANNYNVGLQTRYLAGVYGFAAVATVSLIPEKNKNSYALAKLSLFVAMINWTWVYLRFSIGYPEFTVKPIATLHYLFGNEAWEPLSVGIDFFLLGSLVYIALLPHFAGKRKIYKFGGYLTLIIFLLISCGIQNHRKQILNLNGLTTIDETVQNPADRFPVGEITNRNEVNQIFVSKNNNLGGIQIFMATFARVNHGLLKLELVDNSDHIIRQFTENTSNIIDNSLFTWNFRKLADSQNKTYTLRIIAPGTLPGEGVTVWVNPNASTFGQLRYGDKEIHGNLVITTWDS